MNGTSDGVIQRQTSWDLFRTPLCFIWNTPCHPGPLRALLWKKELLDVCEFSCCSYAGWWTIFKLVRPSASQTPYWAFHRSKLGLKMGPEHPSALLGAWHQWLRTQVFLHLAAALSTTCQPLLFETFSPLFIASLCPSGSTSIFNYNCPLLKQRSFTMIYPQLFLLLIPPNENLHTQMCRCQLRTNHCHITSLTVTLVVNTRSQFLIDC